MKNPNPPHFCEVLPLHDCEHPVVEHVIDIAVLPQAQYVPLVSPASLNPFERQTWRHFSIVIVALEK